ncbi:MAG: carbamoyl phosphate synthase small subunit, partial [Kiritimatiellia bacterium]|nr:carbamoyl phosphate synthase small subunit [Kiritimatiellia bacterium]
MKCMISTVDLDPQRLAERARQSPGLIGRDLAAEVSVRQSYVWPGPYRENEPFSRLAEGGRRAYDSLLGTETATDRFRVAVLDCGIKINQLRLLSRLGCDLTVFPHDTPAEEILAGRPDGCFVSNGPGDPEGVPETVSNLRKILDRGLPTFGICFGHQLVALALGGRTYKLKFGHRGANQPVLDRTTGKVEITSQNHGFAVDMDSFSDPDVEHTHINLNDGTSEGLRHRSRPIFTVQYHPEAAPGPHDSTYLFTRFMDLLRAAQSSKGGAR